MLYPGIQVIKCRLLSTDVDTTLHPTYEVQFNKSTCYPAMNRLPPISHSEKAMKLKVKDIKTELVRS